MFLIMKISQYGKSRRWVQLFSRYSWTIHDHHIKITWQTKNKHYISTTRVPMTTKLARMVTNPEELLPMLLDPLVTWSWKVMWQTKTIISILTQCLQPPILGGVWLITRVLPIKSRKILWSRGHARSPKTILHPLYLWP